MDAGAMGVSRGPDTALASIQTGTPQQMARSPLAVISLSNFNRASRSQARRTLESQLAETERRIQDASRLGSTLVQQRQELAERLKDIETQHGGDELGPQLRQKLVDLEREYNEVGQETARALVPRSRKISQEMLSTSGNRSQNYTSDARTSPTKPPKPEKPEHALSGRAHDIQFVTDISASLLGQVRSLQALLAERDETIKVIKSERADLQADLEGLGQKIRGLDDSEQRYRDENWSLETQIQDLSSQLKEAQGTEQRLLQALHSSRADHKSSEKELDDVKQVHNRLLEERVELQKQHDVENSGLRRNLTLAYKETDDLLQKVGDLRTHNKELAAIVAMGHSEKRVEGKDSEGTASSHELLQDSSPDRSPPPSPSKNTPRPGALESETLKSSLQHAHRMIQNLKTNIHREKTEKLELKRLLQDARDDIELKRAEGNVPSVAAKRKKTIDATRRTAKVDKLGTSRSVTEELFDDPSWEEIVGARTHHSKSKEPTNDASDGFETANERESATETEAFHTGVESLGEESAGDLTETEDSHATREHFLPSQPRDRTSFLSTASDEEEDANGSPPSRPSAFKARVSRADPRRGFTPRETIDGSPTSSYNMSSPAPHGLTLASELDYLDEVGLASSTPSRPSVSRTPARAPAPVDSPSYLISSKNREPKACWRPSHGSVVSDREADAVTPSRDLDLDMSRLELDPQSLNHKRAVVQQPTVVNLESENGEVEDRLIKARPPSSGMRLCISPIISQQTAPLETVRSDYPSSHRRQASPNLLSTRNSPASKAGPAPGPLQNTQRRLLTSHDGNTSHTTITGSRETATGMGHDELAHGTAAIVTNAAAGNVPAPLVQAAFTDRAERAVRQPGMPTAFSSEFSITEGDPDDNRVHAMQPAQTADGSPLQAKPGSRRAPSANTSRTLSTAPLSMDHQEAIAVASRAPQDFTTTDPAPPSSGNTLHGTFYSRPKTPAVSVLQSAGHLKNSLFSSRPGTSTAGSRRTSVSSFVSDQDDRSEMHSSRNAPVLDGFEMRNADPRMIQAITQTMIGEFLWKYTRKAGRGEHSDNRHRRFFWIHPYTRTLYWSNQDPSTSGRAELKAKSVGIEAVRVVPDENPLPPGLHPKSIVVVTPGRSIKFTAPTSQRHETWFNALSYLLLRTGPERYATGSLQKSRLPSAQFGTATSRFQRDDASNTQQHTDVNERSGDDTFASPMQRLASPSHRLANSSDALRASGSAQHVPLASSERPEADKQPTILDESPSRIGRAPKAWRSGSIPNKLRPHSGLFGIQRETASRGSYSAATSASQSGYHSRSESLERRVEKTSLENVRACCDGKHDVGSLTTRNNRRASIGSRSFHRQQSSSATSSIQHLPSDPAGNQR